jgi:hypothetical protein
MKTVADEGAFGRLQNVLPAIGICGPPGYW